MSAGRPKRFNEQDLGHGILEVRVAGWKYFSDLAHERFRDAPEYIYRGQEQPGWELEASLDRELRRRGVTPTPDTLGRHLDNFRRSIVGRRGPDPPRILEENEWWALGQHQGLWTPLLDWTRSPYAAAFFCYERLVDPTPPSHRAVFVLDTDLVEQKSADIRKAHKGAGRPSVVDLLRPEQHENARLISQGGLFSRAPDGQTIEAWLRSSFAANHAPWVLMKILLPEGDREEALKDLNRMNVSRASLFPDLAGASAYCNMALQIDQY